ncbi:MAG: hypothetical protein QXI11_07695 [Thermoproteota archaeon]
MIDNSFIEFWSKKYDDSDVGSDEEDYREILKKVSQEVNQQGTITKSTFFLILNWKAPRVKGIIKNRCFHEYEEGIKKAIEAPDEQKLQILDELYGIGIPIASTILHFIYPSTFPIMDVRVTEVLHHFGYLKAKTRSRSNYVEFRRIILSMSQCFRCTLREIDRALFAYHKIVLGSKLKACTKH